MPKIEVEGTQLLWARELRRFSEKQAANKLGFTLKKLQSYEKDLVKPSLSDFRKFSEVYAIPEATLLMKEPPSATRKHLEDFRTRTIEGRAVELTHTTHLVISKVRSYQWQLKELLEADPSFAVPKRRGIDSNLAASKAGEAERSNIRVSVGTQLRWVDEKEAFRTWRRIIEKQGVYVYMADFPTDDCRGVSIMDDKELPAIIINKNERARHVAWTFSLIHEYAHILAGKPGISDRNFQDETEAFCNRFAAAFLMPLDAIKRVLHSYPLEETDWDREDIVRFARYLKVSQQAVALRLEELGLAPKGYFAQFRESQLKIDKKSSKPLVPWATRTIFALGERFPTTVISAADKGIIGPVKVTQILGAHVNTVDSMRIKLGL